MKNKVSTGSNLIDLKPMARSRSAWHTVWEIHMSLASMTWEICHSVPGCYLTYGYTVCTCILGVF